MHEHKKGKVWYKKNGGQLGLTGNQLKVGLIETKLDYMMEGTSQLRDKIHYIIFQMSMKVTKSLRSIWKKEIYFRLKDWKGVEGEMLNSATPWIG